MTPQDKKTSNSVYMGSGAEPYVTSRLLPRAPHLPMKGIAKGHFIPHGQAHLMGGTTEAWVGLLTHLWALSKQHPVLPSWGPHLHTSEHTYTFQRPSATQNWAESACYLGAQNPSYLHSKTERAHV